MRLGTPGAAQAGLVLTCMGIIRVNKVSIIGINLQVSDSIRFHCARTTEHAARHGMSLMLFKWLCHHGRPHGSSSMHRGKSKGDDLRFHKGPCSLRMYRMPRRNAKGGRRVLPLVCLEPKWKSKWIKNIFTDILMVKKNGQLLMVMSLNEVPLLRCKHRAQIQAKEGKLRNPVHSMSLAHNTMMF